VRKLPKFSKATASGHQDWNFLREIKFHRMKLRAFQVLHVQHPPPQPHILVLISTSFQITKNNRDTALSTMLCPSGRFRLPKSHSFFNDGSNCDV